MDIVEQLTRKVAKRTTADGAICLQTDGDPDLVAAFAFLGWTDPHVDPEPEPEPAPAPTPLPVE